MKINGIATGKGAVATFGGNQMPTLSCGDLLAVLVDKDTMSPVVFVDATEDRFARVIPIYAISARLDEDGRLVIGLLSPAAATAKTNMVAGSN